jgi:hypothetical protein
MGWLIMWVLQLQGLYEKRNIDNKKNQEFTIPT